MNESKTDRFRRVAEARVNKIIKMIRLLGNCSGTGVYEYTDTQAAYIFSALQSELDKAKKRFRKPSLGKHRFSSMPGRHICRKTQSHRSGKAGRKKPFPRGAVGTGQQSGFPVCCRQRPRRNQRKGIDCSEIR